MPPPPDRTCCSTVDWSGLRSSRFGPVVPDVSAADRVWQPPQLSLKTASPDAPPSVVVAPPPAVVVSLPESSPPPQAPSASAMHASRASRVAFGRKLIAPSCTRTRGELSLSVQEARDLACDELRRGQRCSVS